MTRRSRPSRSNSLRLGLAILAAVLGPVPTAGAQVPEPIGPFVVDLRAARPFYGQDPEVAAERALSPGVLPSRGLGLTAGAHVYPLRWWFVTIGLGAEWFASRGRQTTADEAGEATLTVETRFRSLAPQLSFNFGTSEGWSYLSGGIGPSTFAVEPMTGDVAEAPTQRARTINYGGGARWFMRPHLAFSFDLRFYSVSPVVGAPGRPGHPRMTLFVLNVGASFN